MLNSTCTGNIITALQKSLQQSSHIRALNMFSL